MTSYRAYRPFFLSFLCLLFFCATPSFSSNADVVPTDIGEATIDMGRPTCSHKPNNPYTMQNPPEYLENNFYFNYLKKTGYIYWVTGNVLASVKYVTGIAVTGVSNAALWDFVSEGAKKSLGITTAVLTLTTIVLQGLESGVSGKAKRYKKEAKAMIAQANLNAGLPVQAVLPSEAL